MTLSMVVTSLLQAHASACAFQAVRDTFEGLPYDHYVLQVLFSSLLDICDLAISYDPILKNSVYIGLESLPKSSLEPPTSICN